MKTEILYNMACAGIELGLCLSHLLVHTGLKNSKLSFISTISYYFIMDGFLTFLNLYTFYDSYNKLIRLLLVWAVIEHIYYVCDLLFTKGKSRIFYWSCLDCKEDRFSLKFLKENLETLMDITCHFLGFYMFCSLLPFQYAVFTIIATVVTLYFTMVGYKDFSTEIYMMPMTLQKIMASIKQKAA